MNANDVTIKRTRIRNPGCTAISIAVGRTGTLIEDVEIDGTGSTTGASAVVCQDYTGNVLIEGNLLAGGGYTRYGGDSSGWTGVRLVDNIWHETGQPVD